MVWRLRGCLTRPTAGKRHVLGIPSLGALDEKAFFKESLRNRSFTVNCFIGIWNKSSWSVFYLPHREAQPSILRLAEGRNLGLAGCSRAPSEVKSGVRKSYICQIAPLSARVTTTTGSLVIVTRETALFPCCTHHVPQATPRNTEQGKGSVFMVLRLLQHSLLSH